MSFYKYKKTFDFNIIELKLRKKVLFSENLFNIILNERISLKLAIYEKNLNDATNVR